jgi:predicted O-linked N-acetylglucosamine transferase (SPINDLY family)
VVELARERGIDIAIDLGGHTGGARTGLFARRLGPVQVSYLGYLGTMGAPYIDYLVADEILVPEDCRSQYAEKIAYLPSYQPHDPRRARPGPVPSRESLGLPEAGFVFCCFNNTYKINPAVFDIWMRILARVEASVLFLYAENAFAAANLRREATARGVDARRLVFGTRLDAPAYLARYAVADLFLDTMPYNAGTTASDALWAGLPVLTCSGQSFAARMAASLLRAAGLPGLIAPTRNAYEELAVKLATDSQAMGEIRRQLSLLREGAPLFDSVGHCRSLEAAYSGMHERHKAGLAPAHIGVDGAVLSH